MSKLFSLFRGPQKAKSRKGEFPTSCPYCGQVLPKRPSRKRKCPFCKEMIYVRTDPETREKVITTEEGAHQIDARKKRIAYRNRWLRVLGTYGITSQHVEQEKARLRKRFRREPVDSDVFWGLFNSLAMHQPSQSLYYQMALFLDEEGRDFIHALQQSHRIELLNYKEGGITEVEISTVRDEYCCPSCPALEGKVFRIDNALEQMPIPNRPCTAYQNNPKQGFCRCTYLAIMPEW